MERSLRSRRLWLMILAALAVPAVSAPQGVGSPPLPPRVARAKAEIISISASNLQNWGDPDVQARLDRRAEILAEWFADNRPENELELTRGSWKALWYEDPSIIPSIAGVFETDRENTYQVVRDGFYYNVAKIDVRLLFVRISIANFLKGEFEIKHPASPDTLGQRRRNVIDLEFTDNRLRFGWLPTSVPLVRIVDAVDEGEISTFPVPGPRGSTGELWNLFVDEDLRVAFGTDDDPSTDDGGLFVLVRQRFVSR